MPGRRLLAGLALALIAGGAPAAAPETVSIIPAARPAKVPPLKAAITIDGICTLIGSAADHHGVPKDFFTRLIYKESRFDVKALSPVGAQGIAQFMPATAKARGLSDPWDPAEAIPHSAWYLAEMHRAFGNWGLAAAGYNGGPHRVEQFLARGARLPRETVDYVKSITFRPVTWFRNRANEVEPRPLDPDRTWEEACRALPILPTRAVFGSTRRPWGVQVAGGRSYRAALNAFKRVRRRYANVIGTRSATIVRSRRGIRGAPYQARIGASSRKQAGALCARLKRAGAPCVVLRN